MTMQWLNPENLLIIICLYLKQNISQTGTDQILNDVTEMIENTVSRMELRFSSILTANGFSMKDIKG